jgi:hypothetical protein
VGWDEVGGCVVVHERVMMMRGRIPLMTWLRCWAESARETARIRRGLGISIFAFSVLILIDSEVDNASTLG